jgi:hypothetical protein
VSQARASASVLNSRAGRLAGEMLTNRRKAERAFSSRPMTASGPALQRRGIGAEPGTHRHHVLVGIDRIGCGGVEQLAVLQHVGHGERVEMLLHLGQRHASIGDDVDQLLVVEDFPLERHRIDLAACRRQHCVCRSPGMPC